MPFFSSTSSSSLTLLSGSVSSHTFSTNCSNQTFFDFIQWILFICLSICLFINLFSWVMCRSKLKIFSQTIVAIEPKGHSSISSDRNTKKKTVASSASAKPNGKSSASSAVAMKPNRKSAVSSAILMKSNASTALSSAHDDKVMFFRDVKLGPHEVDLRFRLIHFWEARNPNTKTLIGQEMLLIDEEGTVIQGYAPSGRVGTYELTSGSVYKLSNFSAPETKLSIGLLIIAPPLHSLGILNYRSLDYIFTSNEYTPMKSFIPDYVGHMKLVNGQTITDHTVLDEAGIAEKRHLCVHVQTHDGPVMKLYLWDKAASDFCEKFKSYGSTPSVLLVTTLNPKHLGGTLVLTSMASSRVFMDTDVRSLDYIFTSNEYTPMKYFIPYYVGHMKLVNGQTITDHTVLDEAGIAEKRHLCVHVQTHDGPVMKLYLWDKAASDFCEKFKSYGSTPSVLLVTTLNPKHLGGTLVLTSMASSRVFMDTDVQPSKDYLGWLRSNSDIANKINAEVVTKPETTTLEELFSYIKQATAKQL
ncbi:hypothetical protein F2Q68_00027900 [Brassica cretica]|uniref:Uncharacterized protein n=1 Tax=Brassica cretica TaxID=69181 RepID=A0A8S9IE21_BRACR|nr:hypothetical protein F2Q68_00027900 [Brassica cretica]